MSNFCWIITEKRKNQFDALEKIPEYGKKSKAELLEMALDEFILKHGNSQNPQTRITLFEDNMVKAIPNIYETNRSTWVKFYSMLTPEDYDHLDQQFNWLLTIHNNHLRK